MKCVAVDAPDPFSRAGRGPDVARWITSDELAIPSPDGSTPTGRGDRVGAIVEDHWVVFHGLQVIQFVPDEVHTGWQYETAGPGCRTSVWRVVDSEWMKTFDPYHLAEHDHFVLEFYEETVELICRKLLFGRGDFAFLDAAQSHVELCHAFLFLAQSLEKQGRADEAAEYYERYIAIEPDKRNVGYAKRCLEHLQSGPGRDSGPGRN